MKRIFLSLICSLMLAIPLLAAAENISRDMLKAAENGEAAAVKTALEHGADVNALSRKDGTSLNLAARRGHTEIVRLLLEHDAYVDSRDVMRITPLIAASFGGYTEIVGMLLVDGVRHPQDLVEVRTASRRDRAAHGARVPQRKPFVSEGADDRAFVARSLEGAPALVERVGLTRQLRKRLLVGLRTVQAALVSG